MSCALSVFEEETGFSPRKVTVHKRTPYSTTERKGFENALRNVPQHGLTTISRRGIFCLRPGRKPIIRGTAIAFDGKVGFVFSSGYVPFLRGYSGNRRPQPLEITENWGSISFEQVARDLLRLTKLDLNSSDFCTDFPITLARCREIRDVLQILGQKARPTHDTYYL